MLRSATALFHLLLAALLTLALSTAASAEGDARVELDAVPAPVRDAMMAGKYGAALTALDRLVAEEPEATDFWTWLRGLALAHDGKLEEAAAVLEGFEREFPQSRWRSKARFELADVLRRLRRFEEAEAIYEAAVGELRAEGRQRELARIYLDFADALSIEPEEPRAEQKIDYARAFTLYTKTLDLDLPRDLRDYAMYRQAVCKKELLVWDGAIEMYIAYLAEFDPDWDGAALHPRGPGERVFEARLALGACRSARGDLPGARRDFEDLIGAITAQLGSERKDPERRAELIRLAGDASFAGAFTWMQGAANEVNLGIAALRRFLDDYPDHEKISAAAFEIGAAYQRIGRFEDALTAYDEFLARGIPETDDEEVREEATRLARRALFSKGEIFAAQKRYDEAIGTFTEYTARHTTGPDWAAAQRGILEAEYAKGISFRADEKWAQAREVWTRFLEAHPLDGRAAQILFDIGMLYYEEASEIASVEGGDRIKPRIGRYRDAIAQWHKLPAKYPGTNGASMALYHVGTTLENDLGDLEAAIEAFRACNFGSYQAAAQSRLAVMTVPSLAVRTERTWRSNEAATVLAQVRNVEELEIAIYELDLEAYFRKHLTHRSIEALDLDLIAPDQTLTIEVNDYQEYAPIEQQVKLPVEGPGVWAVALTADDKRATTLVIRSDIDVIVKSSRAEVFVFAEEMTTEKAAEGVTVLIGLPATQVGAAPVFHEVVTDASGIARLSFPELKTDPQLRILATREGHFASNGISLDGLGLAAELEPRGFVYTDRTAYKPGQLVHWRAILRQVEDGQFTFERGMPYQYEAVDPNGRTFARGQVELGQFGTVHGDLYLDEYAILGTYLVNLRDSDGRVFSGNFQVQEYQLQRIELTIDFDEEVYYRGETVEAELVAAYYYGEPVTGSPIHYSLPDGRSGQLRTDHEGKAKVTFETRDMPQEGLLTFRATLTEEHASALGHVYLALRGFSAELHVDRELYLAGDRFNVELTTRAPGGDPVSRSMKLQVLKRESRADGSWAEVLSSEHELTSDEKDGTTQLALQIDDGGWYTLRVEGFDRFGNPVIVSRPVFISGDEDQTRLRILVDAQTTRVGEKLELDVHNRAGAGLVLLTLEGEEVLEYRLLRLEEGHNRVELAIGHDHYPNFAVAASMMRGNLFYTASSQFLVERELRVKISPSKEIYEPGEEAVVVLEVTDQLGRPVSAELALSVFDTALIEMFPESLPKLAEYFQPARRNWALLSTASSCTFSYEGSTQEISADILAENLRQEMQGQWAEQWTQTFAGLEVQFDGDLEAYSINLQRGALAANDSFFLGHAQAPQAQGLVAYGRDFSTGGLSGGADFGTDRARVPAQRFRNFHLKANKESAYGWGGENVPAVDPDSAFWTPAVVTDVDGRARIRFTIPERSTRWRLSCRGVDRQTTIGEGEGELVSRSEFFVELHVPQFLTEGDRLAVTARVHNLSGESGEVELRSSLSGGGVDGNQVIRVEVGGEGVVEHTFELTPAVGAAGPLKIEVTAAGDLGRNRYSAEATEELSIRPWGIEYADSASGVLTAEVKTELELPVSGEYTDRSLEIHVGPGVDRVLVDAVLGTMPWARQGTRAEFNADVASDLLGACAVLELFTATGREESPERADVRRRATGLVARLVATQTGDGGWAWGARTGQAHAETSCRGLIALQRARELGLVVPPSTTERASQYLAGVFRQISRPQDELKAMIVYALACAGTDDFSTANRLHRLRQNLSPAALAYLTRALARMGRTPMALEVAEVLEERVTENGAEKRCSWPVQENAHWNRSELGMTALALLALIDSKPESAWIAPAVETLLSSAPWFPSRTRGVVVAALASARGKWEAAGEKMKVAVSLDGRHAGTFDLSASDRGRTLRFPLPDGTNRPVALTLTLEGQGKPHWAAVLRGFSRKVESRKEREFYVRKTEFLAAAPMYRGKAIPTGFGVTRRISYRDRWKNHVEHIGRGRLFQGYVEFAYDSKLPPEEDPGDYLVLDVPLPAGTQLLEGSVTGNHRSYEVHPGRLLVQVGQLRGGGSISYTLIGSEVGEYKSLPAILRSTYQPGRFAVATPMALTVLDRDRTSPDSYRPTPDELFHLGRAQYNDRDYVEARGRLGQLYDTWRDQLHENTLRETAEMMLFMGIEEGNSASIVRFFEVLKEKNPDLYVPFDKVLAIGRAYRELGEFERALLIFKATIDETFGKDLKVAGALDEQQEFAGSVDTLERLWLEYPDSPVVLATYLALADKLLTKAPNAHLDESLQREERDRLYLSKQGVLALERFLTFYPEDPLAPDAGLNLVSAHLSMENYEQVRALGARMAKLYTKPQYADAFEYSRAVAEWYLGLDTDAQKLLGRISESTYTDEEGITRRSANRELALYILAQIHHARREFEKAAEYYEKVAEIFSDAREVLEEFREKRISLPEVTTSRVGEKAKLELSHRNLTSAEILVYPVDLLTLYLREKNLSRITQVNLAGISPTLRRTFELEINADSRSQETEVELELTEAGAYLVICRGDELHTSGLVLVTDVELEVTEDPLSGRLRVTALDQESGHYLRDVDVRVVGSGSGEVQQGKTDPRGLFIADGVGGVATVIALHGDGQYAFHRGETHLGAQQEVQLRQQQLGDPGQAPLDSRAYFKNVIDFNILNNAVLGEQLNDEIQQSRKGVQVKQVK